MNGTMQSMTKKIYLFSEQGLTNSPYSAIIVIQRTKGIDTMRDFAWNDTLYAVIKDDGNFAGVPCTSFDEARELAAQHKGAKIFFLTYEPDEPDDNDVDLVCNPYFGCETCDY